MASVLSSAHVPPATAATLPLLAAAPPAELPAAWRTGPCVVLSTAKPHVVLCANAAWLSAFGYDAMHEAVLGTTLPSLVVGSRTEIVLDNMLHFCCLFPDGGGKLSCAAVQLTLYDAAREEVPAAIEITHCRAQCFEHTAPNGAVLLVAMHLAAPSSEEEASITPHGMPAATKPRKAAKSFDQEDVSREAADADAAAAGAALPRALHRRGGGAATANDPHRSARLRPGPQQLRAFLPSDLPALIITHSSPAIIIAANEAWTHFFAKTTKSARARVRADDDVDASANDENTMGGGAPRPKSLVGGQQQLSSVGHSVHCIGGVLQDASDLKKIEGFPAWGGSNGEIRFAIARNATPHPSKSSSAAGCGWLCVTQFGIGDSSATGGAKKSVGSTAAAAASLLGERFQLVVVRHTPSKPTSHKDQEHKQRRREAQARCVVAQRYHSCISHTSSLSLTLLPPLPLPPQVPHEK